ncbi:hypothetical protein ACFL2V_14240 [Pseudomonadota bacterium]
MKKVYSTFEPQKAEELVQKLIAAGIDAHVVDYSQRKGAGIGTTIDQIPTVYINDVGKISDAIRVIETFDPSVKHVKEEGRGGNHPKSSLLQKVITFIVVAVCVVIIGTLVS